VTLWLAAVLGMLPPLAIAVWCTLSGSLANRLVALQLATAFASFTIILMSFAFDQPSLMDLALTLAFLSLPGTLLLAVFVERWL
jgi:multicomponent Na+:H+ antiporter subunit F